MKRIVAISTKEEIKSFIDFPHDLYANDSNYVPELFVAQRDLLTPGKHPFHTHSQVQLFLAYDHNKIVGRIAAILNNNHNQFNNTQDGFFGFFDCVDDVEISDMLFNHAEEWLKQKGASSIIGPANFSTNETCGLLVDGYDSPPFAMMPYNKAYYQSLLDEKGFSKKVDLIAYRFGDEGYNDKSLKIKDALLRRLKHKGITIRPVDKNNFQQEVARIREVYNAAWDRNLGFVPMTEKEFDHMAKDVKLILDTDFCMVAEKDGKVVGFALAIPDINQVLINIKRGRLLPLGLFKLLFGLKKINGIRIIALGVVEGYRKLGIEACFYGNIIEAYRRKKFKHAEASWILEGNDLMNRAIQNINGHPHKRYRIFEKAL
jgi:GNAT superfamily N-acetyltransferase